MSRLIDSMAPISIRDRAKAGIHTKKLSASMEGKAKT